MNREQCLIFKVKISVINALVIWRVLTV